MDEFSKVVAQVAEKSEKDETDNIFDKLVETKSTSNEAISDSQQIQKMVTQMSINSLKKTMPFLVKKKPVEKNMVQLEANGLESLLDDSMADAEIDSGDGQVQQPVDNIASDSDNNDLFVDEAVTAAPTDDTTTPPPVADEQIQTDTSAAADLSTVAEPAAEATVEPPATTDVDVAAAATSGGGIGSDCDEVKATKLKFANMQA